MVKDEDFSDMQDYKVTFVVLLKASDCKFAIGNARTIIGNLMETEHHLERL